MNQANTLSDVLAAVAPNDKTRRIPPLDKWQPTQVSPIDIEIRDNGDVMRLDEAHLPYFGQYHHEGQNEERLYVDVRFNLKARFLNNAFFHLVNMGELSVNNDNKTVLNISSGGKIHCMTSYL